MKAPCLCIFALWLLTASIGVLRAQQFEVSSVVSFKPGEAVGIKLKGTWKPSPALAAEDSAQAQVIVFSARNKKKPEQRFKLAAASFPTSPDDEVFRTAVANQLNLSQKAFSGRGDFPHYATLVYNPNSVSGNGITAATIALAQPCLVGEDALRACFGDEKTKTVVWMQATLDAGGAIQDVSVDDKEINIEPLREAIEASLKFWKFTPARENGVNVASTIRFPLPIVVGWEPPKPFDAAQEYWLTLLATPSGLNSLDQWPRLVKVAPLNSASLPRIGGTLGFDMLKPLASYPITVTVTISSDGELKLTPLLVYQRRLVDVMSKGLSGWRFTPPLHGGRPCSVEFLASVTLLPRSALEGPVPKPLFSTSPEYPKEYYELVDELVTIRASDTEFVRSSLRTPQKTSEQQWQDRSQKLTASEQYKDIRSQENKARVMLPTVMHNRKGFARLHGAVEMALVVDPLGNVARADITKSKSPIFDTPAMWAIYARKYLPLADGIPVRKVAGTVDFGRGLGGPTIWSFDLLMPANTKPDSPVVFSRVSPPVFPRAVPASVTSGRAAADIHVDVLGRVTQVDIVEASLPEFGFALRAALETSQFVPVVCGEKPVSAIVRRTEDFERPSKSRDSLVLVLDSEDREFVSSRELDRPLAAIVTQPAVFPLSLIGRKQSGEAVVEILISRSGQVCEPTIVSASEPEFGFAAVQAVSSWGFLPPTQHGDPVSVKVRTTLRFDAPAAAPGK